MSIKNILEAIVEMFQILHDLSLKKKTLPTYKQGTVEKRQDILFLLAQSLAIITVMRKSDDQIAISVSLSFSIDVLKMFVKVKHVSSKV